MAHISNNYVSVLYSIDLAARQLSYSPHRIQIFCYLEQYLPCTKQTILGRIKKLKTEIEDSKVQHIETKLRDLVNMVMPELNRKHEERTKQLKAEYDQRKNSGEKMETQFRSPRRKFLWSDEIRYEKISNHYL